MTSFEGGGEGVDLGVFVAGVTSRLCVCLCVCCRVRFCFTGGIAAGGFFVSFFPGRNDGNGHNCGQVEGLFFVVHLRLKCRATDARFSSLVIVVIIVFL